MREAVWSSPRRAYLRPLPGRLGVTPRGRSGRLQRVLTDFGCELSFVRAAQSVREHYGFDIGATAVRTATLHHAGRAQAGLEADYKEPFRLLPPQGAAHVIAQADGTMICTVAPGAAPGQAPTRLERDQAGCRPSPRQRHHPLCRHLWQRGGNRAALGTLHPPSRMGLE